MLVLVAGLPFVNRLEPVVFGLPFLLVLDRRLGDGDAALPRRVAYLLARGGRAIARPSARAAR